MQEVNLTNFPLFLNNMSDMYKNCTNEKIDIASVPIWHACACYTYFCTALFDLNIVPNILYLCKETSRMTNVTTNSKFLLLPECVIWALFELKLK